MNIISVLMLCSNRAEFTRLSLWALSRAIERTQETEYRAKFKVSLINNGSSDETGSIIDKFTVHSPDVEIEKIHKTDNQGIVIPMNEFWEKHKNSDFLGKIDNDCMIPSDNYIIMQREFKNHPWLNIVSGYPMLPPGLEYDGRIIGDRVLSDPCIVGGADVLMRSKCYEKFGPMAPEWGIAGWQVFQGRVGKDSVRWIKIPCALLDTIKQFQNPQYKEALRKYRHEAKLPNWRE